MNKNIRQTKPLGRSTKEDNAGLSLLRPRLFEVIGDTYNYFNAIIQNTFKSMSPFLKRLTKIKFIHARLPFSFYHDKKYLSVRTFNENLSSCRTLNIYWIF